MLVLSRRPQQSLLIGHDVVVTVLEVNGDTVRIGIKAPSDVDIHREEIYQDLREASRPVQTTPGSAAELTRRIHAGGRRAGSASGTDGHQRAGAPTSAAPVNATINSAVGEAADTPSQ